MGELLNIVTLRLISNFQNSSCTNLRVVDVWRLCIVILDFMFWLFILFLSFFWEKPFVFDPESPILTLASHMSCQVVSVTSLGSVWVEDFWRDL